MARSHIAIALATACFGLLATFQLISQFGIPDVGFFHFKQDNGERLSAQDQNPLLPWTSFEGTHGESRYLLGTGKADITG
ncbi:MAG: hypothetical protein Q9183_004590, partial [Haloplaca sp. 2 TL-2023]